MTKLEALNILLTSVGVLPVSSYQSTHPDAVAGRAVIERFNSQIQERGWWFNREYELTLKPQAGTGVIILPKNTLKVEALNIHGSTDRNDLVQRGNQLYNMKEQTFAIGRDVVVDIVVLQDFEICPIPIQTYIARSAAYEYATMFQGDQHKLDRLQQFAFTARSEAMADELRNGNFNAHQTRQSSRTLGGIVPFGRGSY
jgi:hypothetical protein